jgi:hypothetical protein
MNSVDVMIQPVASIADRTPNRVRTKAAMSRDVDSSGAAFAYGRRLIVISLPSSQLAYFCAA